MLRRAGLWLPSVAFMVAIVGLARPGTTDVDLGHWDKLVHVVAYGLFALVNFRAFHGTLGPDRGGLFVPVPIGARASRAVLVAGLTLTLGFGAFDEWNQTRLPGRDGSVADWLADVLGALLALAIWSGLQRRRDGPA